MDYSLSELPLVYDLVDIKILVWCIARLSLLPIMEFVGVIANVIRDIDGFADRAPRDQPDWAIYKIWIREFSTYTYIFINKSV